MVLIINKIVHNRYTIFILTLMLFVSACKKDDNKTITHDNKNDTLDYTKINKKYSLKDFLTNDSILNAITDRIYNSMSDTDRISQMIMTSAGNNGKPINKVKNLAYTKKIGGVLIMGGRKNQIKNIIKEIDSIAYSVNSLPLFYSADAEPGYIERIDETAKYESQGNIKTEKQSDSVANEISKILSDIGININFAPVCDVSNNKEIIGNRSFGKNIDHVIRLSLVFINKTQSYNIISTAKHFPGHGNVIGDSHKKLVYLENNLSELEIFKSLIDSGVCAVMVGHIAVKDTNGNDTRNLPSSLSNTIVSDLLRNKLGFKGLIISDALNMTAVTKIEQPALKAAIAGCDILLMPTDENKIINSILAEISINKIFALQIEKSIKRIIKAKICVGLVNNFKS